MEGEVGGLTHVQGRGMGQTGKLPTEEGAYDSPATVFALLNQEAGSIICNHRAKEMHTSPCHLFSKQCPLCVQMFRQE